MKISRLVTGITAEEDHDRGSPTWSRFLTSTDTSRPVAEVWFDLNEDEFMRTLRKALGI